MLRSPTKRNLISYDVQWPWLREKELMTRSMNNVCVKNEQHVFSEAARIRSKLRFVAYYRYNQPLEDYGPSLVAYHVIACCAVFVPYPFCSRRSAKIHGQQSVSKVHRATPLSLFGQWLFNVPYALLFGSWILLMLSTPSSWRIYSFVKSLHARTKVCLPGSLDSSQARIINIHKRSLKIATEVLGLPKERNLRRKPSFSLLIEGCWPQ